MPAASWAGTRAEFGLALLRVSIEKVQEVSLMLMSKPRARDCWKELLIGPSDQALCISTVMCPPC